MRSEMVAARTSHVATPNDAGLPATLPLMAFRTIPKRAKSRTMAARETRKARKTINEAKRNPNCLDPRAMICAIKAIPQAMGWRMRALDARSAFELS